MEKEKRIITLYFDEKKTLTEIAEILEMSVSTVSRILSKNPDYMVEKKRRKEENHVKRRLIQRKMIYENKKKKYDNEYHKLQAQLKQDTRELSNGRRLNNNALRKWCSAYTWNEHKKAFEFDRNIKKSDDLPRYIKV